MEHDDDGRTRCLLQRGADAAQAAEQIALFPAFALKISSVRSRPS
jgi:hypothetical protein